MYQGQLLLNEKELLWRRQNLLGTVRIGILEKVFLAEELPVFEKALVGQSCVALDALEAPRMPRSVHHFKDEAVQDHSVAASASGYRCCNRN